MTNGIVQRTRRIYIFAAVAEAVALVAANNFISACEALNCAFMVSIGTSETVSGYYTALVTMAVVDEVVTDAEFAKIGNLITFS